MIDQFNDSETVKRYFDINHRLSLLTRKIHKYVQRFFILLIITNNLLVFTNITYKLTSVAQFSQLKSRVHKFLRNQKN